MICDDLRFQHEFDSCIQTGWLIIYLDAPTELRKQRSDDLNLIWAGNHNSEQSEKFKSRCTHIISSVQSLENMNKNLKDLLV